ncbi:MAG: class I SAM-dependent methyltransferase [bacterium]
MNLKETYNLIAEEWHKDHQADDWWVNGTKKFIVFLKSGDTVLDVGCGGGTKSKYLTSHGLKITGIDLSDKMVEIARRENPESEFFALDLNQADTLSGSFDGIFVQAVLLHIPKDKVEAALKKVISKLKEGGYIYVSVKEQRPGQAAEEVKTESDYGYEYQRFFSYFTDAEIERLFKNLGLEIVHSETNPAGKTNWIQVIGKK